MSDLMMISDVARKYKVSKRTLRYYEEIGLLKSIRKEGCSYRFYDRESIGRLQQIMLFKNMQFSLNEIFEMLVGGDNGIAVSFFCQRLIQLNKQIDELTSSRDIIESFIKICNENGIESVNVSQLLSENLFVQSKNERMISMENKYEGDLIKIEIGTGLISLADVKQDGSMIHEIKNLRNRIKNEKGVEVCLIRIRDNDDLNESQYRILYKDEVTLEDDLSEIAHPQRTTRIIENLSRILEKTY